MQWNIIFITLTNFVTINLRYLEGECKIVWALKYLTIVKGADSFNVHSKKRFKITKFINNAKYA